MTRPITELQTMNLQAPEKQTHRSMRNEVRVGSEPAGRTPASAPVSDPAADPAQRGLPS
jgi:hypothetical protein